jgi:N-acetylglucosamine-6-sulfatase
VLGGVIGRLRAKHAALPASLPITALAALTVFVGIGVSEPAAGAPGQPNIVLITTDDQAAESLRAMRRTRELIGAAGTEFRRYFATFPLCCPARATLITGQYAHNHGVLDNLARFGGGYPALRAPGEVLPVWLERAGYDTALIGKWLHDYRSLERPPGWSTFHALLDGNFTRYFGYALTDSAGGAITFGEEEGDYQTDTLTNRFAVPYIRSRFLDPDPFFLHLSYTAPHWGRGRADDAGRRCSTPQPFRFETARPKPAPRHAQAFLRARLPRPPSFNERDITDKPSTVASKRRMTPKTRHRLTTRYRCELATLLAADEGVARVIAELEAAGIDDETVVIFTSDNGYMHGEHRIVGGKVQPYEEAVRVPLLVRGPGFAAGERSFDPVGDVDLAATVLEIAGATAPAGRPPDGIPLSRTLRARDARDRAILLEAKRPAKASPDGDHAVRSWVGVRTRRYTYVEHHRASAPTAEAGYALPIGAGPRVDRELYDNRRDPYQVANRRRARRYAPTRRALAELVARLADCRGDECVVESSVPAPRRGSAAR